MKQVVISSDIEVSGSVMRFEELVGIKSMSLEMLTDSTSHLIIQGNQLERLAIELYEVIDLLLEQREIPYVRKSSIVQYRGAELELDWGRSQDVYIESLIMLLDLAILCKATNGLIYLLNRNLFNLFECIRIVYLMRVKYVLTIEDILEQVGKIVDISVETAENSIELLIKYRMVEYCNMSAGYKLTPRGYMLY